VSVLEPEWDPGLVEAAVLLALRAGPDEPRLRAERDPVYTLAEPEGRDAAFARLHVAWFERLDLARPLRQVLREFSTIGASCHRAVVLRAIDPRDEHADLLVASAGVRTALVRLTAETVAAPGRALPLLRRELAHVADMLDPAFGYDPGLGELAGGPAGARVLAERYRVLWDTSIDGRLARLGRGATDARDIRWRQFLATFAGGASAALESVFARVWGADQVTHAGLLALATEGDHSGRRPTCALCRLPTREFEAAPHALSAEVLQAVRAGFPSWDPVAGLCLRCAEHYRALAATSH
jgi:hypothetical protein